MIAHAISRGLPLLLVGFAVLAANAQVPRERVVQNPVVEDVFSAPSIITTQSVTSLPARNLNVTIHHAFAPVDAGTDGLFGLDGPANIRIGLDLGITDWLSVGVGRSRYDRLYDFRTKATVLRQRENESIPIQLAVNANAAVTTVDLDDMALVDRMSYSASVMVARRFSDKVSVQVAPTISHVNTVFEQRSPDGVLTPENTIVAIGLGAEIEVVSWVSLLAEYVPVLTDRSDGTADALALGVALDTGGHVFQLFLSASPYAVEQQTIGQNVDDFFDGNIRLGFTVNRVFGL